MTGPASSKSRVIGSRSSSSSLSTVDPPQSNQTGKDPTTSSAGGDQTGNDPTAPVCVSDNNNNNSGVAIQQPRTEDAANDSSPCLRAEEHDGFNSKDDGSLVTESKLLWPPFPRKWVTLNDPSQSAGVKLWFCTEQERLLVPFGDHPDGVNSLQESDDDESTFPSSSLTLPHKSSSSSSSSLSFPQQSSLSSSSSSWTLSHKASSSPLRTSASKHQVELWIKVMDVVEDQAAHRQRICKGDFLWAIDGQRVTRREEVLSLLQRRRRKHSTSSSSSSLSTTDSEVIWIEFIDGEAVQKALTVEEESKRHSTDLQSPLVGVETPSKSSATTLKDSLESSSSSSSLGVETGSVLEKTSETNVECLRSSLSESSSLNDESASLLGSSATTSLETTQAAESLKSSPLLESLGGGKTILSNDQTMATKMMRFEPNDQARMSKTTTRVESNDQARMSKTMRFESSPRGTTQEGSIIVPEGDARPEKKRHGDDDSIIEGTLPQASANEQDYPHQVADQIGESSSPSSLLTALIASESPSSSPSKTLSKSSPPSSSSPSASTSLIASKSPPSVSSSSPKTSPVAFGSPPSSALSSSKPQSMGDATKDLPSYLSERDTAAANKEAIESFEEEQEKLGTAILSRTLPSADEPDNKTTNNNDGDDDFRNGRNASSLLSDGARTEESITATTADLVEQGTKIFSSSSMEAGGAIRRMELSSSLEGNTLDSSSSSTTTTKNTLDSSSESGVMTVSKDEDESVSELNSSTNKRPRLYLIGKDDPIVVSDDKDDDVDDRPRFFMRFASTTTEMAFILNSLCSVDNDYHPPSSSTPCATSLPDSYFFAYLTTSSGSNNDKNQVLGAVSFFLLNAPDLDMAMTMATMRFKFRRTLLLRDFIVVADRRDGNDQQAGEVMWTWLTSGEALLALQAIAMNGGQGAGLWNALEGEEEEIVVLCDFRCSHSSQSFFLQRVSRRISSF